MQGRRITMGSSTGTIHFDYGATSSSGINNAELFWNDELMPEILPSSDNTWVTQYGSDGAGGLDLSLFNQGEASSSSLQNSAGSLGPMSTGRVTAFKEWNANPTYLSQDNNSPNFVGDQNANRPLTLRSSSNEASHQNPLTCDDTSQNGGNRNVGISGQPSDPSEFLESPNFYRSGFSATGQGPVGSLVGDNSVKIGDSRDAGRLPCKRKLMDEDIGQSFASGSSRSYRHVEGTSEHPIPVDNSDSSSNNVPSDIQLYPVYKLPSRGIVSESPHAVRQVVIKHARNLRSVASAFTPFNDSRPQHVNASLPPPVPAVAAQEVSNRQALPAPAHIALPPDGHAFRRSRSSSSRSRNSPGVVINERDGGQREATLRTPRELSERQTRAQRLTRVSRSRSLSASHGSSNAPTIIPPDPNPAPLPVPPVGTQPNASADTPARLSSSSEQMFTDLPSRSAGVAGRSDRTSASNTQSLSMPGAASSRQQLSASRINSQRNQLAQRRLAILMQRRGNGLPVVPPSFQSIGAASDDESSRRLAEIWSAFHHIRGGEHMQAEDMTMLNRFGMAANLQDRHSGMRLDVDSMSYEELLALEERIGNVNTGLTEEAVLKSMKQRKFTTAKSDQGDTEPCCICQEEYNEGEDLGVLDCGHNFHTFCVKQWLMLKNLCPVCKTTGLALK